MQGTIMTMKLGKVENGRRRKVANTASDKGSDINLLQPRERKVKLNRTLWWVCGKHESINHQE